MVSLSRIVLCGLFGCLIVLGAVNVHALDLGTQLVEVGWILPGWTSDGQNIASTNSQNLKMSKDWSYTTPDNDMAKAITSAETHLGVGSTNIKAVNLSASISSFRDSYARSSGSVVFDFSVQQIKGNTLASIPVSFQSIANVLVSSGTGSWWIYATIGDKSLPSSLLYQFYINDCNYNSDLSIVNNDTYIYDLGTNVDTIPGHIYEVDLSAIVTASTLNNKYASMNGYIDPNFQVNLNELEGDYMPSDFQMDFSPNVTIDSSVPEPCTIFLFCSGLIGLLAFRKLKNG
ncbi:MAG: PEP-CTERM sorting domain-containing protein [Syntrophobacteraceae bacterium]